LRSLSKWPWTEYAKFWCEAAGHDVKKLQRLALELKEFIGQGNGKRAYVRKLLKELESL